MWKMYHPTEKATNNNIPGHKFPCAIGAYKAPAPVIAWPVGGFDLALPALPDVVPVRHCAYYYDERCHMGAGHLTLV